MSWSRLDDGFHDHPKVIAAGNAAAGVFAKSITWANHNETDGFIPQAVARLLAADDGLDAIAPRLVEAGRLAGLGVERNGLWEAGDAGFWIHDFLVYNPSARELRRRRKERAEAGRRGGKQTGKLRASKHEARAKANTQQTPELIASNWPAKSHPVPVPVPVPVSVPEKEREQTSARNERTRALLARFDRFYAAYPKKRDRPAALRAWLKLRPDDETCAAIETGLTQHLASADWRRDAGQFVPYPASWLNGRMWEDDPTAPDPGAEERREEQRLLAQLRGEAEAS